MAFPIVSYSDWGKMGQMLPLEDGKVFYVHKGTGFPLLMVHTFGGNSWWYCRVLETLAQRYSVYTLDLPGCAHSETPPLPYDIPDFADVLERFMDKMGIEKTHLVGAGGGAMTSVQFAATRPKRVAKLVLEVIPHWTRAQAKAAWSEAFGKRILDENGVLKPVKQWGSAEQFSGLPQKERAMANQRVEDDFTEHGRWWVSMLTVGQLRYDVNERIPLIQAPTLLLNDHAINGSRIVGSGSYYKEGQKWVPQGLKKARVETIPGAGTRAPFEQPEAYSKLLLDFLQAPDPK